MNNNDGVLNTDVFLEKGSSKQKEKKKQQHEPGPYEKFYLKFNLIVLFCHFINMIAAFSVNIDKFQHYGDDYIFVSPKVSLSWTNHALVLADSSENQCNDVTNSFEFQATRPGRQTLLLQQLPSELSRFITPAKQYPDLMDLYDFTGKHLVRYNKPGASIQTTWAMFAFFVISLLFQSAHHCILMNYPTCPRVMHYIEYSISSSLMIMVMAVNVGITELFAVTGMCAIFFGMNMMGACAEIMSHYAGLIEKESRDPFTRIIMWLLHFAGWILFFFAMIPIWIQFHIAVTCSDGGSPAYAVAAIVIESLCFVSFGVLQLVSLIQKLKCHDGVNAAAAAIGAEHLFAFDCAHAVLSLVAKTFLAWLLMGPAASVKRDLI
jgi:hypothetical protein